MILNFLSHPLFYISLVLIVFTLQSLVMRRILGIGIINPVILTNLSIASSISYLFLLNKLGKVDESEFLILVIEHFVFFIGIVYGIFLVNNFMKFKISRNIKQYNLEFLKSTLDNKIDRKIYTFFLLIISVYKLWFGYVLMSQYGGGDARLELAKSIRSLDILVGGIENAVILITVINFAFKKSLKNSIYLLVVILVSAMTGSKSSIIGILIYYVFFDIIINRRKIFTKRNFFFFILSIISVILLQFIWSGSSSLVGPLIRFLAAGDVYEYAFVGGDYTELIGLYNPIKYLLHPFTAVFGVRGYEYPMGSMLVGTTGLPVGPTGPNPQLLLLNLVLFEKNLIIVYLFTFVMGTTISYMMNLGYYSLFYSRKNIFYKTTSFFVFFVVPLNIYFDIGLFQMHVVKSVVFLIIVFCFRNILYNISSK